MDLGQFKMSISFIQFEYSLEVISFMLLLWPGRGDKTMFNSLILWESAMAAIRVSDASTDQQIPADQDENWNSAEKLQRLMQVNVRLLPTCGR